MPRWTPFLFLLIMVTLLGACAPATPPPATGTPTLPAPTTAAPTPVPATAVSAPTIPAATALPTAAATLSSPPPAAPTPAVLADDVLAVYTRVGGIAGISETLTIHQGGLVELDDRGGSLRTLRFDEAQIQPLRRMLQDPGFASLGPLYSSAGADLIVYTITARDNTGKIKTVTTMDGAQNPSFLGVLVAMLEQVRKQFT